MICTEVFLDLESNRTIRIFMEIILKYIIIGYLYKRRCQHRHNVGGRGIVCPFLPSVRSEQGFQIRDHSQHYSRNRLLSFQRHAKSRRKDE